MIQSGIFTDNHALHAKHGFRTVGSGIGSASCTDSGVT
jgi:hypothetical protein